MYEIELKAHVLSKEKTATKLNSFAQYKAHIEKHDVYWLLGMSENQTHTGITVRIREEQYTTNNKKVKKRILVTHKRKQLKYDNNQKAYEVNEEYEFTLKDKTPFEVILQDSGYHIQLVKSKITDTWKYDKATLELSTVENIGDFLEIEFLSETNDENTVSLYQAKLFELLQKSGLSENDIENRYYSEIIEEEKRNNNV